MSLQLKPKNNQTLLSELKALAENERSLLLEILHYLAEVERRKLHLELGYSDLYIFAQKELKYSSGAAYRRICAMRLMVAVPAVEQKLNSGELCLQTAAQAQGFFRRGKVSQKKKEEVLATLYGKSTRDADRALHDQVPEGKPAEQKLTTAEKGRTLIQFTASAELAEKIDRLKGLLAHRGINGKIEKLVEVLADMAIAKLEPKVRASAATPPTATPPTATPPTATPPTATPPTATPPTATPPTTTPPTATPRRSSAPPSAPRVQPQQKPGTRYIRKSERDRTLLRDGGACTYRSPITGRVCGSRYGLQQDHQIPHAWGGPNTSENLAVRCGPHNLFRAEKMGLRKKV